MNKYLLCTKVNDKFEVGKIYKYVSEEGTNIFIYDSNRDIIGLTRGMQKSFEHMDVWTLAEYKYTSKLAYLWRTAGLSNEVKNKMFYLDGKDWCRRDKVDYDLPEHRGQYQRVETEIMIPLRELLFKNEAVYFQACNTIDQSLKNLKVCFKEANAEQLEEMVKEMVEYVQELTRLSKYTLKQTDGVVSAFKDSKVEALVKEHKTSLEKSRELIREMYKE